MTTTSSPSLGATIVRDYATALCAVLGVDPAAAQDAYGDDRCDDAQLEIWRLHHETSVAGYRAADVREPADLAVVFADEDVVRRDATLIAEQLGVRAQATAWEKHPEHAALVAQDAPWQVACAVEALRRVVDAG